MVTTRRRPSRLDLALHVDQFKICLWISNTQAGKHGFLRYASTFRQHGIRFDDDLTRQQQSDRMALHKDFAALKAKKLMSLIFFRGSVLQYSYSNKLHICREGKANKAPLAEQATSHFWQHTTQVKHGLCPHMCSNLHILSKLCTVSEG